MLNRGWMSLALVAAGCGLAACARPRVTGRGTHPDQMSAEAHRAAADRHAEMARQGPYLTRGSWAPWTYSWDSGTSHVAEHDAHVAAAEVLEARYREACARLPIGAESASPIARHARSVVPVDRGVVLALDLLAGTPEELLAAIRCHRAWLALADRPGAVEDLDALDGLRYSVQFRGELLELSVTAPTPELVDELRRRAGTVVTRATVLQPAP